MPLFHVIATHNGSTCAYKRKDMGRGFMINHSQKEKFEKKHNVKVHSNIYDLVGHTFYFTVETDNHMNLNSFIFEWSGHEFMRQNFKIIPVVKYEQFMPKITELIE